MFFDEPVQVYVNEAQAGRGAPVAEQAWLDMLWAQWLAQQRVVLQVDLSDGQVVGSAPVAVHLLKLCCRKWPRGGASVRLRRFAFSANRTGERFIKLEHNEF